jgi:hypothetical protein
MRLAWQARLVNFPFSAFPPLSSLPSYLYSDSDMFDIRMAAKGNPTRKWRREKVSTSEQLCYNADIKLRSAAIRTLDEAEVEEFIYPRSNNPLGLDLG